MSTSVDRRVTVGVPVRNGGSTLSMVLESLLAQTHRDIQIVVHDNASEDNTPEIAKKYADMDPRVRLVRLETPVTVLRNWELTYRTADTPYFMWAADDNVHSDDYIEVLLGALDAEPRAGLAFGQVLKYRSHDTYREATLWPYECATIGIPIWRRLWMDKNGPFAPYGLFRTSLLANYRWYDHTVSPDWPLFIFVLVRSEITQTSATNFYYFDPGGHIYLGEERARRGSFRNIERFPTLTLSWKCAKAADDAARDRGSRRFPPFDFAVVMAGLLWANRRRLIPNILKRY